MAYGNGARAYRKRLIFKRYNAIFSDIRDPVAQELTADKRIQLRKDGNFDTDCQFQILSHTLLQNEIRIRDITNILPL